MKQPRRLGQQNFEGRKQLKKIAQYNTMKRIRINARKINPSSRILFELLNHGLIEQAINFTSLVLGVKLE